MIAVETSDDGRPLRAAIDPVADLTKTALSGWIGRCLRPDADVYTDGLGALRAFAAEHTHTVIKSVGRAGCETENARRVNVVLSNLKRSLDGAYQGCRCWQSTASG